RFTWHAFRYVDVTGAPAELKIENLEGVVVNTDVKEAGSFTSSNKLFNQILENYRWTQLGNMHGGIPSDCPHRERRGYTGDGQISAVSAIYNFDMAQFYTKWLEDIGEAQNSETGYVPNTAPYQDGGGGTAWGSAFIIIPWNMYLYYGDKNILSEHYEGMKHWVNYLSSELDQDGILFNQGLGEWVPPEKVALPPSFVNTCYYYYCTSLMVKIAKVLGHEEDGQYFTELNDHTKRVINTSFLNKEQSMYSTGRQGADVFPLGFGIVPEQETQNIFQHLVNHTLDTKIHFDTGILATPLLLEVLTELGRVDLAYAMMNQRDFPGFGYMLENNATTIWETWLGEQSHSHPMFGSVTQWFYKYLAGIQADPENPGFKHIIIKPHPVFGLNHAKSTYLSPYGRLVSDWHFEEDRFILDVAIPHNTSATIFIPTKNAELIKESRKRISKNPNVELLCHEGQMAVFEVGSGNYSFSSPDVKDLLPKPIPQSPIITPRDTLAMKGDSVFVQIRTDYPDAKVHYTLDGSEPDSLSNVFNQSFYLTENTTIKAKAFLKKSKPSFKTTRVINFIDLNTNGLTYTYYEGKWMQLPDFDKQQAVKSDKVFQFSLENINPKVDEFGIVYSGFINIKEEGNYTFFVASNDGSKLFINKKLVVDNDGPHGAGEEKIGEIRLTEGIHPIKLNYFQAGGGLFLKVSYSGPSISKREIPALVLLQKAGGM
ncbi:MAG: chitobiase/beta-hexosaminidase C-terminal domain-containing protein, partial [Cyclobacteriaceae bacterium]|nr:chitobiase/beta-hexosaminidase C-terminal domain-containing protein [Cyclobacteriaceae bacterium]